MKKVFEAKGVAVKVTTAGKRYFVEIRAKKESSEGEMKVKNSNFYFRMKTDQFLTGQTIYILLEAEYKLDKNGNIIGINDATKLKFSGKGYKGSITLYPKAYIPKGIRKKKSKTDNGYSELKTPEIKKSTSKYVNYSHNNAGKPYSGGRVSPK